MNVFRNMRERRWCWKKVDLKDDLQNYSKDQGQCAQRSVSKRMTRREETRWSNTHLCWQGIQGRHCWLLPSCLLCNDSQLEERKRMYPITSLRKGQNLVQGWTIQLVFAFSLDTIFSLKMDNCITWDNSYWKVRKYICVWLTLSVAFVLNGMFSKSSQQIAK